MRNYKLFLLLLFIAMSLFPNFYSHKCGTDYAHKHREIKDDKSNFHIEESNKDGRRFLQNNFSKIRIAVDYSNINNYSEVSNTWKSNVKKIVDYTMQLFTEIIKVRPLSSPIKLTKCDVGADFDIDESVGTDGVEADLLLFVVVDAILSETTNVEGWAAYCKLDNVTHRPVAGVIGLSTTALDFEMKNWLEYYTYLIFHETIHVLGLNQSLFDEMYDESKDAFYPLSDILLEDVDINGVERKLIKSPKVLEAAKAHFNCNNIKGVEVENQGGQGSSISHWESRVMLSDIMIAISYEELYLSEITCAFLEDTGWYKVDCYSGGLFKFGKNEGCDFLDEKCLSNDAKTKFSNEFCDTNRKGLCMSGNKNKGVCIISTFSGAMGQEIAKEDDYQYFESTSRGGFYFADYCPVTSSLSSANYFFPGSCSIGDPSLAKTQMKESLSSTSGCFLSSLVENSYNVSYNTNIPVCYKYICDESNTSVNIILGTEKIACPGRGGAVNVPGYTGEFICPEYNEYCGSTTNCNSIADCILKKSYRSAYLDIKSQSVSSTVDLQPADLSDLTENENRNEIPNSQSYLNRVFILFGCIFYLQLLI